MARILAIEPDHERGVVLRRLVTESLDVDVIVVTSADDAIAKIDDERPDVILTSSLLPPADDEHLAAHLRLSPALDHLPLLTVPPLVETTLSNGHKRGLWARLLVPFRRRQETWRPYDFSAVAARIEEALEQSRRHADQQEPERLARLWLLETRRPLLLTAGNTEAGSAPLPVLRLEHTQQPTADLHRIHQPRAPRWRRQELPWLDRVKLTWGGKIQLVNISGSGLLVESDFRFKLGNRTEFNIVGPEQDLIVRATIVRSSLIAAGTDDAKYVTAATFSEPFELLDPRGPVRDVPALVLARRIA